jgi:ATP-dependent exoDNAse (exonuclease V) beta subunit
MTSLLQNLLIKNSNERDNNILFDDKIHSYTIISDKDVYESVTTFIHKHFKQFDSDLIIDNMMKSKKWNVNKYYGMSKEDIQNLWKHNAELASQEGTLLHYDIECFYNNYNNNYNNCSEIKNNTIEYQYFLEFVKDHKHLIPYRTEWRIYHEEIRIAGTIDMTFEDEDGNILIYDWKRSKQISKSNLYNKFAITECINHLPDSNFWHYSLQLNIYKKILEEKYSKKVIGMFLVCLHPNNVSYQKLQVPNLTNELNDLFQL